LTHSSLSSHSPTSPRALSTSSQGLPYAPAGFASATNNNIFTKRAFAEKAVGGTVFLIVGIGAPRRFYLWECFTIEQCREEGDNYIASGPGWQLMPPQRLEGGDFDAFRQACANFVSFRKVNDLPYHQKLKELADHFHLSTANENCERFCSDLAGIIPEDGDIYYYRGLVRLHLGKKAPAREDFQKTVALRSKRSPEALDLLEEIDPPPARTGPISLPDGRVLTDLCVYTIKHSDDLASAFANGGKGTFEESRRWVLAKEILDEAKQSGRRLPVIFAPAEVGGHLTWWALLDEVRLGEKTGYTFSELHLLDPRRTVKTLKKASDGEPLSPAYIRPYSICRTPEYLAISSAGDGSPTGQAQEERDQWDLRRVRRRLRQSEFRTKLLAAYGGRCAISGCDVDEALESAHIQPHADSGSQEVTNGILLRADVHALFDEHLVRIHPDTLEVILADRLRQTTYADLAGKKVQLPEDPSNRPSREALERRWNNASEGQE
jgi:hypothetical protein